MRVFTSVFVVEALLTSFDEMAETASAEVLYEMAYVTEASRRHVVDLHVKIEGQRDRQDGRV